ncbi:MAG TPA: pre-peptidase C-terminal domain-containing protein [Thermoanaerobaculia bacterium]|nr:pre-peptidase C-terminal domain-containing protein [Thermoanaerobaculia bacterium]
MARRLAQLALSAFVLAALVAPAAHAVAAAKDKPSNLAERSLVARTTTPVSDIESMDTARPFVAKAMEGRWESFREGLGGEWVADVDKRSGRVSYVEGAGIPWVPGHGNDLTIDSVKALSKSGRIDVATLEAAARAFLPHVADLLGVDPAELELNQGASGQPASHVWFVDFDVVRGGMKVEGAHVVFRVNNGNLIQFGSENLPTPGAVVPQARFNKAAARQALGNYLGGFEPGDRFLDRGSLHLIPLNVADDGAADGYRFGDGRGLALVWQFTFKRAGEAGTWRGRVDATSGEVMDFLDVNEYGSATGGTYRSDRPATEVVMPLPFANVASGVFTNSAGIFSGTTGTTTLNGQFVAISDSCGAISKAADGSGVIALGSSSGTDCTTPGSGGAGNTHASRTQFYNVNRIKEKARGWLPSNTWLNAKLTANVNLNQTCNAYWNGSTLNFFRSGGGCANTGELPGVSLHEFGHGLDSNDGNGSPPENGTGETTGDTSAFLAIHASCVGNGFLGSNCGGYGNACTSCTGVRDVDWAKHSRNVASTVDNFTRTSCPAPSANNPNYVGPCGADASSRGNTANKREGHCESLVSSEALWDVANRDLPNPGSGAAWSTLDRLWYLSRSTATGAFTCNTSGGTRTTGSWTSTGCSTGSIFRVFRAIDDDDGNLGNGTPHGGAIFNAMNRHGIACTTDAGASTTFAAVTPPATPSLSITAGSNSAALSWTGSSGVFDVFRNEAGCTAGFTKVANDLSSASFNDTAVANGVTYFYQVAAQPSGNEAASSAPSTCTSVTPTGGVCTPPAAPTGLTATAASATQINLSWTASAGATSYTILRSTTSGGPYSSVGTSTSTSFSDTTASCNTTFFYVVTASNGTCSSGNSGQAQATTNACTGNVLTKDVPVNNISGATGNDQFWTMSVPAGATNLKFTTSGGTGDVDLYVRFGSPPTTTTNDCKSEGSATAETCTIAAPSAGTYHVLLHAFATYSGVSLVGTYTTGGGGTELISNGGFESGVPPWVQSGSAIRSTGSFPHSGTAYSLIAGADNSTGAEYQQISIPSTATGTLTFWLNISSAETTTTTQFDIFFVEVRNTAGTLLSTLGTFSNLNKAAAGTYTQRTFDVSAFKGQTVRIQFRGTTDSSLISTFRVDDVSVK